MAVKTTCIKNFWIAFFAILTALAVASAIVLVADMDRQLYNTRMSVVEDENYYKINQENGYKQSLYACVDSAKNLDANLGKIALSHDLSHQAQMLVAVVVHANALNQNLAHLPVAFGENLSACQTFANQTQDYATYLLQKVAKGGGLTAKEREAIASLDAVAANVYDFFSDYAQGERGNMYYTNSNGLGNVGSLTDALSKVDVNAFSYEQLIYDGPFSDSVTHKTLPIGNKISHKQGEEVVSALFGKGTFVGEVQNNGTLYLYDTAKGRVELSAGGNMVEFDGYRQPQQDCNLTSEQCIAKAEEFCQKLGYNVKGVWVSKSQDFVTYVNCAPIKDGVIIYPQLVKVAVDCADGEIVGVEARAYLINQGDYNVQFGGVSADQAQKTLEKGLKVTNVGKALVQKGNKTYLCHEFECQTSGTQYYVYVDSYTGNEVDILRVVEQTEGHTVM